MNCKENSPTIPSLVDKKELNHEDLLHSLNIFSSEFNKSDIYDRVLVFQVDHDNGEMAEETRLCQLENGSIRIEGDDIQLAKEEKEEEEEENEVSDNVMENKTELQSFGGESLSTKSDEEVENKGSTNKVTHSNGQFTEHKLLVHSCWMAVQSSYFKSLFYSGMKESHSKEVVMKVSQNELQAHLTLIEAIYKPGILNDKEHNLVVQVLVLADKYVVELIFKKCKYVLMDIPMTLEICELILKNVSNLPNCDDLFDCLKKFLVKEFSPLDRTWTEDKFIELSEPSLNLLLSSDNLAVQSENTVFVALMKWMENNDVSPSSSWLLSLVRFELMTVDFLCDVVENHPIAEQMCGFDQCFREGLAYHCFSQERRDLMEDKPVVRPTFGDEIPSFEWVIDTNVRKKLLVSLNKPVYSSNFWYKGYFMALKLKYNADSHHFGIFLKTKNITREACLNISWVMESNLFVDATLTDQNIFGSGGLSCGYEGIKSDVSLVSVPEDISHTIKLWITLL